MDIPLPILNRRDFLKASAAACVCAANATGLLAAGKDPGPVDVGPLSDFAQDGIWDQWAYQQQFFVVRLQGRLFAPTAICTHEPEPLVATKRKDGLYCSEHDAYFMMNGQVRKGPPKRALPRYAIRVNEAGHVLVDKSKSFPEAKWDDPAAWVAGK